MICVIVFLQQQLQSLLETLNATEPHYIRCVKPNNLLKPAIFENHNVLQQLRCGVSKRFEFLLLVMYMGVGFTLTLILILGSDGSN